MPDPLWLQVADAAEKWATVAALVAGGLWAYYRFGLKRESETALELDLTTVCIPYSPGLFLVFFDVACINKGGVRIVAKKQMLPSYKDESEQLNYSIDLLLRPIGENLPSGTQLKWFASPSFNGGADDIEVNLVDEYESQGKAHFWMEPGERYNLSRCIILKPGNYIAKVTFIGNGDDDEFWRRLFLVTVPNTNEPAVTQMESHNPVAEQQLS